MRQPSWAVERRRREFTTAALMRMLASTAQVSGVFAVLCLTWSISQPLISLKCITGRNIGCISALFFHNVYLHSLYSILLCSAPNSACINGAIRLADGESDDQGRVEYCLGGEWGTVCADSSWDNTDAQVICRQLGYNNTQGTYCLAVITSVR